MKLAPVIVAVVAALVGLVLPLLGRRRGPSKAANEAIKDLGDQVVDESRKKMQEGIADAKADSAAVARLPMWERARAALANARRARRS